MSISPRTLESTLFVMIGVNKWSFDLLFTSLPVLETSHCLHILWKSVIAINEISWSAFTFELRLIDDEFWWRGWFWSPATRLRRNSYLVSPGQEGPHFLGPIVPRTPPPTASHRDYTILWTALPYYVSLGNSVSEFIQAREAIDDEVALNWLTNTHRLHHDRFSTIRLSRSSPLSCLSAVSIWAVRPWSELGSQRIFIYWPASAASRGFAGRFRERWEGWGTPSFNGPTNSKTIFFSIGLGNTACSCMENHHGRIDWISSPLIDML